jgi:hypothetical protein
VNHGMRSCVDTLGRSAPAAMGVATCYDQEGQILRLNAKGIIDPCLTGAFREVSVKIKDRNAIPIVLF